MIFKRLFLWVANLLPNFYSLRFLRAVFLRFSGVKLNPFTCYFLAPINFDNANMVSMGKGVFINRNCTFEGNGKVLIGSNVQIGPGVVFATTNHKLGRMDEVVGDINIKDNVWIGANVVITQGVILGPNLIVGAGAIVTKSFSNCKIAGVPAKKLVEDKW